MTPESYNAFLKKLDLTSGSLIIKIGEDWLCLYGMNVKYSIVHNDCRFWALYENKIVDIVRPEITKFL